MPTGNKGVPKGPSGWQVIYYSKNRYRMYIKGSYAIRQMRFSGGSVIPWTWEVLCGNKIVAVERTRNEAVAHAERLMGKYAD